MAGLRNVLTVNSRQSGYVSGYPACRPRIQCTEPEFCAQLITAQHQHCVYFWLGAEVDSRVVEDVQPLDSQLTTSGQFFVWTKEMRSSSCLCLIGVVSFTH